MNRIARRQNYPAHFVAPLLLVALAGGCIPVSRSSVASVGGEQRGAELDASPNPTRVIARSPTNCWPSAPAFRRRGGGWSRTSRFTYSERSPSRTGMVRPVELHNVLVNLGLRRGGLCYEYAECMLAELRELPLTTLELQRGIAWKDDLWNEHNCVVVTAIGQPFESGVVLDAWRNGGRLRWAPVRMDHYPWQPKPPPPREIDRVISATDAPIRRPRAAGTSAATRRHARRSWWVPRSSSRPPCRTRSRPRVARARTQAALRELAHISTSPRPRHLIRCAGSHSGRIAPLQSPREPPCRCATTIKDDQEHEHESLAGPAVPAGGDVGRGGRQFRDLFRARDARSSCACSTTSTTRRSRTASRCPSTPTWSGTATSPTSSRASSTATASTARTTRRTGHRFNPNKVVLDPYAKAIGRDVRWDDSLFGYKVGDSDDLTFDDRDSAAVRAAGVGDRHRLHLGRRPPAAHAVAQDADLRGATSRA